MSEQEARESGELVVGLVTPVGSYSTRVEKALTDAFDAAGYEHIIYQLSKLFGNLSGLLPAINHDSEDRRLETAMKAGNELRRLSQRPEIMAIQAAAWIAQRRPPDEVHARRVHILRSLKRSEEVEFLRRLYGPRFVLISVYVPRERRVAALMRKSIDEVRATQLVNNDEDDGSDHGQATRDAFHLADLFLDGDANDLDKELTRFFDLLLGSPRYTPTKDEHGMFLAHATSLRSGDLSRQVGAVLMTKDGTLVAEGCNDAPRYGGGPQWPDGSDTRDLERGSDPNEQIKAQMVQTLQRGLDERARKTVEAAIVASGMLDITEYGRAVHAEMAALMSCARLGVASRGCTLYCTTFPCHNCAKHIVAAGVETVFFIEPYPKSRATELHDDALSLQDVRDRVFIRPFVGVGPRRYLELFSLRDQYGARVRRKRREGTAAWDRRQAMPAVHDRLITYTELELNASAVLKTAIADAEHRRARELRNKSLASPDQPG